MPNSSLLRGLGEEIRERRTRLDFSQEGLAHAAGLHRNLIGKLERGDENPTLLTLLSIATELDVSVSELIIAAERRRR